MALVVSLAALAGCVSPQTPQALQAQRVQAVLADQAKRNADALVLIDEALTQPLTPDSIFREGDKLSFQVAKPATATAQPAAATTTPTIAFTLQIEASCSIPLMSVMYSDSAAGQFYPSAAHGVFGPASLLTASHYAKLMQNPNFVQACADKPQPDWRIVKGDSDQQWVMIDAHSLQHRGAEVVFWAASDNPTIRFALPYNAPQAQVRERYAVDCARQTYRLLTRYDLDNDNQVTDGHIDPTVAPAPIVGSDADQNLLFSKACASPEQLALLPSFKPRAKVVTETPLPPLSAQALAAVKQLNLPSPAKSLVHLTVTGTSGLPDKQRVVNNTTTLSTDNASGLLLTRNYSLTTNSDSDSLSFRGLITLSMHIRYKGNYTFSDTVLTALSFSGDWLHMPVGVHLSYAGQITDHSSRLGKSDGLPWVVDCTVVRERAASEVNAALSGRAKELSCVAETEIPPRVTRYMYLVDYGYFFQSSIDKNPRYYNDLHLQSAE